MIENLYTKDLACSNELARRVDVFRAGFGRSGRMVVSDNDCVSIAEQRGLKYFSWVNQACRDGSVRYDMESRHLIFSV